MVDARPARPVRGAAVIAPLERPFLAVDRIVDRLLPAKLNPFAQTGAIANTTFIVAIASGILLLFWYVPSVGQAHASLEAIRTQWWGGQLARSVHRYSSDACMLFVLLHAWRLFAARRFSGPRWLAWVTGLAGVGLIWLVGWLGYWLVWDQGSRAIALGTARVLDVLPIFADPLSRSFLTDEVLNSLLFFVVFFLHMLIPLAIAVALWLHITRLSRSHFLTGRTMTLWVLGTLLVVSLVFPAVSSSPARMLETPTRFAIDAWYVLPILLTDRLSGGVLWLVLLVLTVVIFTVPWTLSRARAVTAVVDASKCNACYNCASDCPYGAIRMMPRTDGRKYDVQAVVDASKCVGCGICSGSCDSAGIGVPWLAQDDVRHNMDAFLARRLAAGGEAHVGFVCAGSVPVRIDPDTGETPDLPGYLAWPVPCAGWVHPLTIERALRHGAKGVLVVACPTSSCEFREGALWTEDRVLGRREPELRRDKIDSARVRVVHVDRVDRGGLRREADAFRTAATAKPRHRSRVLAAATGIGLAAAIGAATSVPSAIAFEPSVSPEPVLVVSFKHPGRAGEHCHTLTAAEKAKLPAHMRRDRVCERGRTSVRVRVRVDGRVAYEQAYTPRGVFGDGNSIAVVRLPVALGTHRVEVALGDSADSAEWSFEGSRELRFVSRRQHVVTFDRTSGFTWR